MTSVNVLINYIDEAREDFRSAKKWYAQRSYGLNQRFGDAVRACIESIGRNPLAFRARHRDVRVAYTKVFPYGVYFVLHPNKNEVTILAILHNKRAPETVLRRL